MSTATGMVTTFYSYKGGTGRTMALANTAVLLARENRGRVLMVDWDLEAPGLHEFFPGASPGTGVSGTPQLGVLELFEHATQQLEKQGNKLEPEAVWESIDLSHHIASTEEPLLDLMPAGNFDEAYGDRVGGVPWRRLFAASPTLFRSFADTLARRYRHVLIDSRTGVTDSSGVCTTLLPDHLVLVFTPNRQSLTGAVELAATATAYRSQSVDIRPLLVFPLASRVETSEDALRSEWRHGSDDAPGYQPEFETALGTAYDLPACDLTEYFDEIQIQHVPRYAYGERIAVSDQSRDRLSMARSYEQFTRALTSGSGPWDYQRARSVRADGDPAEEKMLRQLEAESRRHWLLAARAARRNLILRVAEIVTGVAAIVSALAIWIGDRTGAASANIFGDLLPLLLIGTAVVGGFEFVRRLFDFEAQRWAHARAGGALERECALFEARGGDYADARNPLALLAERRGEIQEKVDKSLLGREWTGGPV